MSALTGKGARSLLSGLAIVAITRPGVTTALRLLTGLPDARLHIPSKLGDPPDGPDLLRIEKFESGLSEKLRELFDSHWGLVLFMALGAAVRLLAPCIRDKRADPAVVVVDDLGKFAISALSGHRGGANDLARRVSAVLHGQAVITTASDVVGTLGLDMLGKQWGWQIEDEANLTRASAALVNGEAVGVFQDSGETFWRSPGDGSNPVDREFPENRSFASGGPRRTKMSFRPPSRNPGVGPEVLGPRFRENGGNGHFPENLKTVSSLADLVNGGFAAHIIVSDRVLPAEVLAAVAEKAVIYRPKTLVLGVGCRRGTPVDELEALAKKTVEEAGLSLLSVARLASWEIKRDEVGLVEFGRSLGVPVDFFTREELDGVSGHPGVCEPAALLSATRRSAAPGAQLVVSKHKTQRATVAVARIVAGTERAERGKLFIVGLGPGDTEHMTLRARQALMESQTVIGYATYLKLITPMIEGKEVIASAMKEEVSRAMQALDLAGRGRKVALVSSGDAGIYGMAGPVWELIRERGWESGREIEVEVVPGVAALNAAASLLGAPLVHDFAAISLSDLLTPWETIVGRLEAAAETDMVVVLYNPRSQQRTHQLIDARAILLRYRRPDTPVGIVTNAYREGQKVVVTDLERLLETDIGMLTTIVVGNSNSFSFGGKMVTPRGYSIRSPMKSRET